MAVETPDHLSAADLSRDPRRLLRIGRWRADAMLDQLSAGSTVVKLEPRTMRVLMKLAEQPGTVVSSEVLHDTVWRGVVVSPASIYQAIAQLRRIFESDDGEPYIATVPRKGYRLVAPVAPVDAEPEVAPLAASAEPAARLQLVGDEARRSPLLPRRRAFGGAAAIALLLAAVQVARRPGPAPGPIRLAIMPLRDAGPLRVDEGLAWGLTQDLVAMLQRRDDADTFALDSVTRVRGGSSPAAVSATLGATHVVTGELLRDRRSLRLDLALVRPGETGAGWRGSFVEPPEQLGALAHDAARGVIAALGLKAGAALPAPAASQAYGLLLLGESALRERSFESIRHARDYFQRSIDVDPTFARGHAALAAAWLAEADSGGARPSPDIASRVRALLDRALALDPALPEALVQRGALLAREGQGEAARRLFDRAIAASPSLAAAHRERALSLRREARATEAETSLIRAAALDPLDFDGQRDRVRASIATGRLEAARAALAHATELSETAPALLDAAVDLAFAAGRLDDALSASRRRLVADPSWAAGWRRAALAYLDLGLVDPARGAFDRAIELGGGTSSLRLDRVQAQLDDRGAVLGAPGRRIGMLDPAEAVDALLFPAMAGAAASLDALERAARRLEAEPIAIAARIDALFLGRDRAVDLAVLFAQAGEAERARAWHASASAALDAFERHGNVGAALTLQRARLAAVGADAASALDTLDRAIEAGWRRAWFLRRDPAFASIASNSRFERALARLDERIAQQRARSLASA